MPVWVHRAGTWSCQNTYVVLLDTSLGYSKTKIFKYVKPLQRPAFEPTLEKAVTIPSSTQRRKTKVSSLFPPIWPFVMDKDQAPRGAPPQIHSSLKYRAPIHMLTVGSMNANKDTDAKYPNNQSNQGLQSNMQIKQNCTTAADENLNDSLLQTKCNHCKTTLSSL